MLRSAFGLLVVQVLLAACDSGFTSPPPAPPPIDAELRATIGTWGSVPIGAIPAQNQAQVDLGQALFFDKILSGNRDVACATCHDPSTALTDGRSLAIGTGGHGVGPARSLGAGRKFTTRGAPTLLNSGLGLFYLFWDARLFGSRGTFSLEADIPLPPNLPDILTAQAMLPVLNRAEMRGESGDRDALGNSNELARLADDRPDLAWEAIMNRLLAIQEYVAKFKAAFPETGRPRFEQAARALAVFQLAAFSKTGSPFDRYLERDDAAMTLEQKRGGLLFFGRARCSSCHNGPLLGGTSFANVGAPQVGPGGKAPPLDQGRGEHQENDVYRFAFRVAPLRNVELTAPYFHSGAYPTLEAVVGHYNEVPKALREYDPAQLPADVRPSYHGDAATIGAVLATLDGRLQQPLQLNAGEIHDLVTFLKALTDPAARDLRALIPQRVPSGLPVRE